jgi:hypothetical protein
MSGYKHTGMTQEDYQAMVAHAAYHGIDLDSEFNYDAWDALGDEEREAWHAAAAAVADDERTAPRFF